MKSLITNFASKIIPEDNGLFGQYMRIIVFKFYVLFTN